MPKSIESEKTSVPSVCETANLLFNMGFELRAHLRADTVPIPAADPPTMNGVDYDEIGDIGLFDLESNAPLAKERIDFFHKSCAAGAFDVEEYHRVFAEAKTPDKIFVPRMLWEYLISVNLTVSWSKTCQSQARKRLQKQSDQGFLCRFIFRGLTGTCCGDQALKERNLRRKYKSRRQSTAVDLRIPGP